MRRVAWFALLVLIFTIPWDTAISFGSLGTLTRLIGLGVAAIWVVSLLFVDEPFRKVQLFHLVVISFIVYSVGSILWTTNINLTLQYIQTSLQLAVLTYLLWDLLKTAEDLETAMQVFILGSYLAIGSLIHNFMSGTIISTYEVGRYSGAGQNAVEFAVFLAMSLPIAWHLAMSQKKGFWARVLRWVNFAYVPAALFASALTASRTALLVNIPGILYILWSMRKGRPIYRALLAGIIVATVFLIVSFVPLETFLRLSSITDSVASKDFGSRGKLWQGSFQVFLEHPLLGIGNGALSASSQLGTYAHNTFLSVLSQLGIIGFIMFAFLLYIVVSKAIKQEQPFSSLWISVLAIWLMGALSLTLEYVKPTWFIWSMVIISSAIYGQRDPAADDPSPTDCPSAEPVVL